MSALLAAMLATPAAGGTVLTWLGVRSAARGGGTVTDRVAPVAGTGVAVLTLLLAVAAAHERPAATVPLLAGIPAGFTVDGLGAAMVVMVGAVTLAVLWFAGFEFPPDHPRARFCGLILLFATAMLVTVTATNLAVLLIGWEVMGAMSYALIAFEWREPAKVSAAGTAFLTTRAADLGLYLAAGAALAGAGSLGFGALPDARQPWLGILTAGVIAAAAGKSAQLPLSYWLSGAMQGPSGVSALLHSATMVAAGGYLLLRLAPVLAASGFGAPLVAWLGAATALVLGAVAVTQTDLKQLLAASTAAQVGFVVLAAGVAAAAGGAAHLVAHAAVKSLLFLAAGSWLVVRGTSRLAGLAGVARQYPLSGVAFTVGALSLAGVPPLVLWTTKDLVLTGARHHGPALYLTGLAAAVLSALYAGRALVLVWRPAGAAPARSGADRAAAGPLGLLAGASLALGLLLVPQVSARLGAHPEPTPGELITSAALALAALVVALAWGRRPVPAPGALHGWLGLRRAADAVVARPGLGLAAGLARFDDRVVHGAVRGTAIVTLALAGQVVARADRALTGAAAGVAAGAGRLGRLARRPQTGQLHAYYAQAVVLLLVAGVVLAVLMVGW